LLVAAQAEQTVTCAAPHAGAAGRLRLGIGKMLRFNVYRNNERANAIDLSGAYLFGQDGIPVRGDLAVAESTITCKKRVHGACGLSLMWDVGEPGRLMLSTTRLPDRDRPYNLNIELARARLRIIASKIEEWGLFDYPKAADFNREFRTVGQMFITALKASPAERAAGLADNALEAAVTLSERLALFHADVFLDRKSAAGAAARTRFGCRVPLEQPDQSYRDRLREAFDFLAIPMPWKQVEPQESRYQFSQIDTWINFAARARRPIQVGPVIDFDPGNLPEWLYLWEHDYDSLREVIYEHLQHIVKRYARQVRTWSVVSGLHAFNNFNLSFDQIMELTRMCCLLVKKIAPRSQVMIETVMPWGEYYARNQRTIPPQLYADMAVQSSIQADAFGVQIFMGVPQDGFYVRDLMQISWLLDEYVGLHKPVRITACSVPSDTTPDCNDAWGGEMDITQAGHWHSPWSPRLQAEWLQAFYRIVISKPYVDSICWRDLGDVNGHYIPHGGLCLRNMEPKLAFRELRNFRAKMATRLEANNE